jgi:hypothetical protein
LYGPASSPQFPCLDSRLFFSPLSPLFPLCSSRRFSTAFPASTSASAAVLAAICNRSISSYQGLATMELPTATLTPHDFRTLHCGEA